MPLALSESCPVGKPLAACLEDGKSSSPFMGSTIGNLDPTWANPVGHDASEKMFGRWVQIPLPTAICSFLVHLQLAGHYLIFIIFFLLRSSKETTRTGQGLNRPRL